MRQCCTWCINSWTDPILSNATGSGWHIKTENRNSNSCITVVMWIPELYRCISMPVYISWYCDVADESHLQNFTDTYRCYVIVLHRMFGNPSCHFVSDWLMQILCSANSLLPARSPPTTSSCVSKVIRPLCSCPDKPLYDITFSPRFLSGKQMTACE